ncbi:MAG: DNA sulfur modification protein DndE [Thermosipho sp. (in: Bacteria)]|nr:DNA sulfur modification protein DndE [Thermosipho sp. (in: thermotogales)]
MIVKQFHLSEQEKRNIARLKYKTGITNWNILSRWALCLSLSEPSIPVDTEIKADSNVEMTWHVFGGDYHEVYDALVRQRCIDDGLGTDPKTVAKYFRLHLQRGISYLAAGNMIDSLIDLLNLAFSDSLNFAERDEVQ